ncbi:MAG: flagellar protein FlaG [Plesiomonas shigelloides]|jgi:flagellar protein FlaG|uniref:flagellar protein FlaG n=1 Tax=Plesiomonas shigelloides TaxID=703 RepID=UPI000A113178|nr:flagellar protein FlaG [Plesiomonas shigelloides]QIY09729.1 flagellar protein FlaG [Plesiomonas shigelloides]QOH80474.1 flagellar protein FlaG [Plesiomonas shigelloides]SUB62955.1 flagellar protein FlaG [Plesiomonas shigelloides]HAD41430.1 hypothetical protein [Plesiomonas shigelloides]
MDISSHAAALLPSTDSINRQAKQHSSSVDDHGSGHSDYVAQTPENLQPQNTAFVDKYPETSDLSEVTAQIEKFMNSMQRGLAFSIDEKSGSQVVSVLDKRSGEVIRQIPSEDMLVIARQMADKAAGILLKTEV